MSLTAESSHLEKKEMRHPRDEEVTPPTSAGEATAAGETATTSCTSSAAAAAAAATRKGRTFEMRDPRQVYLHPNDFDFDATYQARVAHLHRYKHTTDTAAPDTPPAANSGSTTATAAPSSAVVAAAAKPSPVLVGDAASQHRERQGPAWERHYRQSRGNFFPAKNYLAQAFAPALMPLLLTPDADGAMHIATNAEAGSAGPHATNNNNNSSTVGADADRTSIGPSNATIPSSSLTTIYSVLPRRANGRHLVLECGCGNGSALLPIMRAAEAAGRRHLYVGFDISRTACEIFAQHPLAAAASPSAARSAPPTASAAAASDATLAEDSDSAVSGNVATAAFGAAAAKFATACGVDLVPGARDGVVLFEMDAAVRPAPTAAALEDLYQAFVSSDNLQQPTGAAASDGLSAPSIEADDRGADVVLLIFVLSAIGRAQMPLMLRRLAAAMRPGAVLCFRDYGPVDHSLLRFQANGNAICDGSYVKGDETQQYFFEDMAEVRRVFEGGTHGALELVVGEHHCNRVTNRKTGTSMDKVFVNAIFRRTAVPVNLSE